MNLEGVLPAGDVFGQRALAEALVTEYLDQTVLCWSSSKAAEESPGHWAGLSSPACGMVGPSSGDHCVFEGGARCAFCNWVHEERGLL